MLNDLQALDAFLAAGHSPEEADKFMEKRRELYVYYLPGVPRPTLEQIQQGEHPDYGEEHNRLSRENEQWMAELRRQDPAFAEQLEKKNREFRERIAQIKRRRTNTDTESHG